MHRMLMLCIGVGLLLPGVARPAIAQAMPPATAASPSFLDQAWTEDDRSWFYTITQGSQLIPYYWFLALERADSDRPFLDDQLARFGYLPPYQTEKYRSRNPDSLPVGFVRDDDPESGPWVGMTCAACHTNQISFPRRGGQNQTLLQIDGGPANANFFDFLQELSAAVENTVGSPDKFDRFAARVTSLREPRTRTGAAARNAVAEGVPRPDIAPEDKARLRKEFELFSKDLTEYVNRSRTDVAWGPARLDAFGEIFNRATAIDLNIPENNQAPNAPVSYPFLWDTSWHDFVQWNGSAPNEKGIERLARNVGEVLGVFGHTKIEETIQSPLFYKSSVDRLNLLLIEQRLRKLTSPQWPKQLWPIAEDKAAKGKLVYDKYCLGCHVIAKNRTLSDRTIKVTLTPLDKIGTDPLMTTNASVREANTGPIEGVRMPPLIGAPLGVRERSFAVSGNVVIGVILAPWEVLTSPLNSLDDVNKKLMRVIATKRALKKDVIGDLRAAIGQASEMGNLYREAAALMARNKAALPLQYKARPLNGIWATAPYLHNGSVPNLYEVLLPAARRSGTFQVGSREFDPEKVGFRVDQGSFKFDTLLPGNSNSGHEGRDYGTDPDQLTEDERLQLIEYLKTL